MDPKSREKRPVYWLCLKHRRLEGQGFVAPDLWVSSEPFLRCKDVNGGICELFESLRNAESEAGIKDEIPHT